MDLCLSRTTYNVDKKMSSIKITDSHRWQSRLKTSIHSSQKMAKLNDILYNKGNK